MKNKTNKRKVTNIVLFSLFFLFLFNLIYAVPPVTTTQQLTSGYFILDTPQITIKQYQDYQYNFFIYNITNGILITNSSTNCFFYLANNKGNVIFSKNATYNLDGHWQVNIAKENFTELGQYAYGVKCQDTNLGGAISGYFEVNPSGNYGSENILFILFIILLFYAVSFIGFFGKNIPMTILGGMAMTGLGVYTIRNGLIIYRDWITNYFSYVTIGLGALISIWASIELLED